MYDLSYSMGSKSKWAAWHWISPWDWITICAKWCWCLISNDDGDSFHLRHGKFTYVFLLTTERKNKSFGLCCIWTTLSLQYDFCFVESALECLSHQFWHNMCDECRCAISHIHLCVCGCLSTCRIINEWGIQGQEPCMGRTSCLTTTSSFRTEKKWTRLIKLNQDDIYIQIHQPGFC